MREHKRLNQNIPISNQNACWVEFHDFPNNVRENTIRDHNRDNEHLPSLSNGQSKFTHHNSNSQFSLPPLPHKQLSTYHMPVQHSDVSLLTASMPQILHDQKSRHNIMHIPHPPPKEKHHGDQITDIGATKVGVRRPNAYLKAKRAENEYMKSDVIIKEDESGFSFDINPKACFEEASTKEQATTARQVTTIRSVLQCSDAPLLPGRRDLVVPHPPAKKQLHLEPCQTMVPHPPLIPKPPVQPIKTTGQENTNFDSSTDVTKLPVIESKKNKIRKNIFVCEPPRNTPRLTQASRNKWKNATMKN